MRSLWLQGTGLVRSALFLVLLATACDPVFSADSPEESNVDLRVLIDVSGSMKRTDPDNLRRAAMRLLIGLLPENSTAGMWTFAKYANMNVPLGKVDADWREKAREETDKIHSFGLFTDIEKVLRLASFDWRKPDPDTRRTIILLSDGVVDVSKDDALDQRSRAQILDEILPRFQQNNVTVHTVALSSEADHDLLESLAIATDGWYEKVENAENLQRVFLRLFEKSSPTDSIPIEDNIFEVDDSIEDMTLLVFRDAGSKPSRISTPGGKKFDNENHPRNVKWHHEDGFDLITVNHPETGSWRMDSKIDPDNRVMVVTNLKLSVNKQANHILQGEEQFIYAKLLQDSRPITEKTFLERLDFNFQLGKLESEATYEDLLDNGEIPDLQAADGIYSANIIDMTAGKYQLTIVAEGPTFKRESTFIVNVHGSPLKAVINKADGLYQVTLQKQIKLKGLNISAISVELDGKHYATDIRDDGKNLWTFDVPEKFSGAIMTVKYVARIKDHPQVEFSLELNVPGHITHATAEHENQKKTASDHEEQIEDLTESSEDGNKAVAAESTEDTALNKEKETIPDHQEEEEDIHWILVVAIAMIVNAFLGLIGISGYFYWKKRRKKSAPADEAEVTYE